MPAEVESMMYVESRGVPWHKLGTPVPDVLTAAEAIVAAGLDWAVDRQPTYAKYGDPPEEIAIPDTWAIIRDKDKSVLGVVKEKYFPVQPIECFRLMDSLVDSGDAKYDTAGSLRGGRTIFMAMSIPRTILVGGEDKVDSYLMLTNTYDATRPLTIVVTPIRVVCMNTVNAALQTAERSWSVTHDSLVQARIEEARKALGLTFKYLDEWELEANRLINQDFGLAKFEKFAELIFPAKSNRDPNKEKQLALIGTFESSKTLSDNIRKTKWGAFNALTEYLDYFSPIRTTKFQAAKERRFTESMFGRGVDLRDRAFEYLVTED